MKKVTNSLNIALRAAKLCGNAQLINSIRDQLMLMPLEDETDVKATPTTIEKKVSAARDEERETDMPAKLRRRIGDAAADMLDDYFAEIISQAISAVVKVVGQGLNLGTEERPTAFRTNLKNEVGKRGLLATEDILPELLEGLSTSFAGMLTEVFNAQDVAELEEEEEEANESVPDDLPTLMDTMGEDAPISHKEEDFSNDEEEDFSDDGDDEEGLLEDEEDDILPMRDNTANIREVHSASFKDLGFKPSGVK